MGQILHNTDTFGKNFEKNSCLQFSLRKNNLTTEFVEKNNLSRTSVKIIICLEFFVLLKKKRTVLRSQISEKEESNPQKMFASQPFYKTIYYYTPSLHRWGPMEDPQTPRLKS